MFWIRHLSAPAKAMLLIASLTLLTYGSSLGNAFQAHDDTLLITQNPTAQGLNMHNLKKAFTTFDPELYIPLTLITYQIEYSLFGLTPFVFHLTNLLLHIGSALLLFLIAFRLSRERSEHALGIALFTAAVFAVHPLNTEAVAWAAARKDVLSGFFFFASIWAYLKSDDTKKWYIWSVIFFVLGLMAKVSIVILPVALILIDILRNRTPKPLTRYASHTIAAVIFGVAAVVGKQSQLSELSLLSHVLLWCKSSAFLLWKFFWPSKLVITYDQYTAPSLTDTSVLSAVVVVALLIAIMAFAYQKRRTLFFALAWLFLCLAPSITTFWKNGFMYYSSDRYAYLAIIGITFWIATSLAPYLQKYRFVFGGIVVLLAALALRQSLFWKDTYTLYNRAIALNDKPALELFNLGTFNSMNGDKEKAIELYTQALEYKPQFAQAMLDIGKLKRLDGNLQEAASWFERSIAALKDQKQVSTSDLQAYFLLGEYEELRGNTDTAFGYYQAAIDRAPQYALPYVNLGIMNQKYHRTDAAKEAFTRAVELDPDLLDARYRLAALQAETGELKSAIKNLEAIIKIDPEYEEAAKHLENMKRMVQ